MPKNKFNKIEDVGTVIYKCYGGSLSYGTNIDEVKAKKLSKESGHPWEEHLSDVDIRGIFIPHEKYLYGTQKIEEFIDKNEEDTVYFSLAKFLKLALEGNPNVVEQLFVRDEDILYMHPIGKELRANRHWFISKNAYGRFGSYAWAQLKRMTVQDGQFKRNEKRQRIIDMTLKTESTPYDSKNAMHLIRLLEMGIQILREGTLSTYRENRDELLRIRDGYYTLEEIKQKAYKLNMELELAMQQSTIPNVPDFDQVNDWVVSSIEKLYGASSDSGIFKRSLLQVLPLEYEMVDKTTFFLVANPLVRKISNSEAHGASIPYKDWFIGLRDFSEFKFENTTIEFVHKFVNQVISCNPKHMDIIFSPASAFIAKHQMTSEFIEKMRTLPTKKRAYHTAKGYITGNLKRMQRWESLKKEHAEHKERVKKAKQQTQSDWDEKLASLDNEKKLSTVRKLEAKRKLLKEYAEWQDLCNLKGKLPMYPEFPSKTSNAVASSIGKFGYDTLTASNLYHVAGMFIELLSTGKVENSRAFESEMYAIKHGKYETFSDFEKMILSLLSDLDMAAETSVMNTNIPTDLEEWSIEFIKSFQSSL